MATVKLSPDVNRILYVKNLNYKTTGDDIYDLFGVRPLPPLAPPEALGELTFLLGTQKYGSIRQVRLGREAKAKGTAFVVYEDVMDVRPARALPLLACRPCRADARLLPLAAGQKRLRLAQRLPPDGPVPRRCVLPFSSLVLPSRSPRADPVPLRAVLYHQPTKQAAKADLARREKELAELKAKHNIPEKE